ncbi:MAG TPA: Glu/Leu/Phe/Val dehydrogenase dimerization domain-containing protein, partial [Thermohalobaculum sp.]|nr:Glu/Leu/Phe/Val dehydrogenase dimerization domain-containing protein [Thermohalobaculum sp.]
DGHETITFAQNSTVGLKAIIAIHDTRLGPALGGCRIWKYGSEAEALGDVLRLSRGMSYKAALAGLPLGGGKSVILADAQVEKTPEMMRAMGRAVERLGGRYIVAEDVGATVADMDEIARETAHVSGTSGHIGDPSPWTAEGVSLSLQACARRRLGPDAPLVVSVTGLGHVGSHLCRLLARAGARLKVSDIRAEAVARMVVELGAEAVEPEDAHRTDCDVFAPCALGAVLNARSIPEIRARIVCGAANNQLAEPEDGKRLSARGIAYAPDYLVNAGGLISVARPTIGLSDADARRKLEAIPETLAAVFDTAEREGTSPDHAADALALSRIEAAKGRR